MEPKSPAGSFAKFTAHRFKQILTLRNPGELENFRSKKSDRLYQFWKRDPLAVPLTTDKYFIQKLEYIHWNPAVEKWKLVTLPEDYRWSSAGYYANGIDEFGIITDYRC